MIDLVDDPAKQTAIEGFGQSVSHIAHLNHVSLSFYLFASCYLHVGHQGVIELFGFQLKQIAHF